MAGATVRGVVGQIKWSYYVAAAINGYTVTRGADNRWSLHAVMVLADRFKLKQRPLVFVAPHAHGAWRWPIESIELGPEQTVTARLGPPEE